MLKNLLTLLCCLPFALSAQSVSLVGVNNFNNDGLRDGFSFVALEDIADGTKIFFTEHDYVDANDAFDVTTEGVVEWTANGTLAQGCVVVIHETASNVAEVVGVSDGCNGGSVTASYGSFSIGISDPIYAFASSGSGSSGAILAGVTEIYSAAFLNSMDVPTEFDPRNDYPDAIVWAVLADRAAEYMPALRSQPTNAMDLMTDANYTLVTFDGIDPLSSTAFADVSVDGCDPAVGTACDDGNACTVNDVIQEDCSCAGIFQDTEPPLLDCPSDITVDADAGACSTQLTFPFPIAEDNCDNDDIVVVQIAGTMSGDVFFTGTETITFSASDATGNEATCSFTVTVTDTEAPTLTCPDNIIATSESGSCSAFVMFMPAVGMDACSDVTVTQIGGLESGDFFGIGVNTITFVGTDTGGLSDTCSFTITILDVEPPILGGGLPFDCQNITVTLDSTGTAIADALADGIVPNTVFDCDGLTGIPTVEILTLSDSLVFDCDDLGTNMLTASVTDSSGNAATCTFTVTVEEGDFDCTINTHDRNLPLLAIDVFPNPSQGQFMVAFAEASTQVGRLLLLDTRGRVLYTANPETTVSNWPLDVRHLPQGVYWLRVESADHAPTYRKILLQ